MTLRPVAALLFLVADCAGAGEVVPVMEHEAGKDPAAEMAQRFAAAVRNSGGSIPEDVAAMADMMAAAVTAAAERGQVPADSSLETSAPR